MQCPLFYVLCPQCGAPRKRAQHLSRPAHDHFDARPLVDLLGAWIVARSHPIFEISLPFRIYTTCDHSVDLLVRHINRDIGALALIPVVVTRCLLPPGLSVLKIHGLREWDHNVVAPNVWRKYRIGTCRCARRLCHTAGIKLPAKVNKSLDIVVRLNSAAFELPVGNVANLVWL